MTTNSYDADGRVVKFERSADGAVLQTTLTTYTPSGKPATTTDPKGNVALLAYDSIDRLTRVTDPLGRVATFGYDAVRRQLR